MALVMVGLDGWFPINADYEVFIRGDPLDDHPVRVENSLVGGLHLNCTSLLPKGFGLRPRRLYLPRSLHDEYGTDEIRYGMGDRL